MCRESCWSADRRAWPLARAEVAACIGKPALNRIYQGRKSWRWALALQAEAIDCAAGHAVALVLSTV